MDPQIGAIILAAGRGTRINAPATQNKVVFELNHKPMISYTVDTLKHCFIDNIVVVVGYAKESVIAALGDEVTYVTQENPQGTGHAVMVALPQIPETVEHLVILYGDDSAFYPSDLITNLVKTHQDHHNQLTMITVHKSDPTGLGRILRDDSGTLSAIIEEKNASESQKLITEINTGLYCFETKFLREAVPALEKNPISGEYYLTDVISYAKAHHYQLEALLWPDENIWHGVNTREQLQAAEMRMKQKNAVQ